MSDLVGNPKDRFSHNEAHTTLRIDCLVESRNYSVPSLVLFQVNLYKPGVLFMGQ